jgi:hypothetical protein
MGLLNSPEVHGAPEISPDIKLQGASRRAASSILRGVPISNVRLRRIRMVERDGGGRTEVRTACVPRCYPRIRSPGRPVPETEDRWPTTSRRPAR